MLATVINSKIAIHITKQIMRTFTALRRYALTYDELAKKIDEICKCGFPSVMKRE